MTDLKCGSFWKFGFEPCETIKEAAILAKHIILTNKCKDIMILYNKENSTINDVLYEFEKADITIQSKCYPPVLNAHGSFNEFYDDEINLNQRLINICERKKKGDEGYNRLLFFVAICILHESVHWKFHHYSPDDDEPGNEAGWDFEKKFHGGILDLNYDTCELTLKPGVGNSIVFESPEAESFCNIHAPKRNQDDLSKKIQTTPTLPPNHKRKRTLELVARLDDTEQGEQEQGIKVKIAAKIKNNNEKFKISVPKVFDFYYYNVTVRDDKKKQVPSKYGKAKSVTLENFDLVELDQGQWHEYDPVDLAAVYDLKEKQMYHVSMRFIGK
jgi:hypothetical protein